MKKAVTAYITNENGLILAVSRKHDPWDFGLPGGKVDPGETLEEAIVREVKEETGLDFKNVRKLFVRPCHGEVDFETTTFVGDWSGELFTAEEGRVQWVKPRVLLYGSFSSYNLALYEHILTKGLK